MTEISLFILIGQSRSIVVVPHCWRLIKLYVFSMNASHLLELFRLLHDFLFDIYMLCFLHMFLNVVRL